MNRKNWYDISKEGYLLYDKDINLNPLLEKGGIYIYKCEIKDNYDIYIGSSTNIKRRFRQHRYRMRIAEYDTKFYNHVKIYGWEHFKFKVLEYVDLERNLTLKEKSKILFSVEQKYLDKLSPSLNMTTKAGSLGGFKHDYDTILEYKKTRAGRCYKKIEGKIIRPETKDIPMERSIKKIKIFWMYNEKKEFIRKFDSITDAANYMDLSESYVRTCAGSGKIIKNLYYLKKTTKSIIEEKLFFPLEQEYFIPYIYDIKVRSNRRSIPFEVWEGDKVIYKFNSITKASKFLNINRITLTSYSDKNKLWKNRFKFKIA
jgi:predicted GIY-YIG superfamily endonuclease